MLGCQIGMRGDPQFIERLRIAVEKAGGAAQLAKNTSLSTSVISKYVNGHSEPDRKRLIEIVESSGVDAGWLLTGFDSSPDGAIAYLPFYTNSLATDPNGELLLRDRLIRRDVPYPVSSTFVAHILGASNPDDLGVFLVHGDCMVPTLKPDEVVIVDLMQIDLVEGIHLIVDKTGIHYRRIRLPHNAPVELYSDNEDMYETEKVPDESLPELRILGRVIWHGRKL